jgi:hypothetical protein
MFTLLSTGRFWYHSRMASNDRYVERDPTWNPPNPDPDPKAEGTNLQERLEAETSAVLEQADRGWSLVVVAPKWWGLSDAIERIAGSLLFLLILAGGISQVLWARSDEVGVVLLTALCAGGATFGALWALQVLLQRRVYGRRRSRGERKSAAREKVLKRWQDRANG